jgi:hypothetical protein
VPRTADPSDRPAQISNDLIVNAAVWRNGGSNDETHICDECLRIGLRSIKVAVSTLLDELDAGHSKDVEMAELTARLASTQCALDRVSYDHDRMQERLAYVLCILDKYGAKDDTTINHARWEVRRGPVCNGKAVRL